MIDFSKYFKPHYKYYLNKLNFDHANIPENIEGGQVTLSISDQVKTDYIKGVGINIEFSRELKHSEDAPPMIEVSLCASLLFNDDVEQDVDWANIPLAQETVDSDNVFLDNLVTRASLLISEVTASYGQMPLVTPPKVK